MPLSNSSTFYLDGHNLKLSHFPRLLQPLSFDLRKRSWQAIAKSRRFVEKKLGDQDAIYGVNTGFGYFAQTRIDHRDLLLLQENILKSHASGWGDPLPSKVCRAAMILRLNVFAKGFTGVTPELCQALISLINAQITPMIPQYGSVGASGDLAPLAHLALPLIGLGEVWFRGEKMPAKRALKGAKLKPIQLKEKEGLSLINGTQVMAATGGWALLEGQQLLLLANEIAVLSVEALRGRPDAFYLPLHQASGQEGQIRVAEHLNQLLRGSALYRRKEPFPRVQDPYSIRCIPQIHGPSHDALSHAVTIIERAMNGATDNPLVFPSDQVIVSGGNFHGQCLALALDHAAMALSELANVSERRIELLLNPHFSGLPAFLSPQEGLQSGYMASQYLAASLVNECKLLANPSCTDSIPGNVGVEDHVSMGMTSARKLARIVKLLTTVLATEWLIAAQAYDLGKKRALGRGTRSRYKKLREQIPPLDRDRILSKDIEKARECLLADLIP